MNLCVKLALNPQQMMAVGVFGIHAVAAVPLSGVTVWVTTQ